MSSGGCGVSWGSQSMVAPLRRVVVKSPVAAWHNLDAEWEPLAFRHHPDLALATTEHAALVAALEAAGAEVLQQPADLSTTIDSIYTHDASLATDDGVILLQTGKRNRRTEAPALAASLAEWGVPVAGQVAGDGLAEGGDLVWLDHDTLVAGRGFRTNEAGIAQLRGMLAPKGVAVIAVDLPYWRGPAHVLHLMSVISLLDHDLAVVHLPYMPTALFELLVARGIELVECDPAEWDTQGCNVLAVAPRHVLMIEGNPRTQARLEAVGCRVTTFPGSQIAVCGDGGPTCLTRPLWRA